MIPNKSPTPKMGDIVIYLRNGHNTPALVMKCGQDPRLLSLYVFCEGNVRDKVPPLVAGTGSSGGWRVKDDDS